jgi:hypothetical protein
MARQLRQATSRRAACRDLDHGRHGELPRQPAHEQVATDALVATRADLLLQVRCAVYNGLLGSGFGHLFEPVSTPDPQLAKAA